MTYALGRLLLKTVRRFVGGIFEKWHQYERMVFDKRSAFIHCTVLGQLMFVYTIKLMQLVTLHKGNTTGLNLVHYQWKGKLMSRRFTYMHLMPKFFNILGQQHKNTTLGKHQSSCAFLCCCTSGGVLTRFRSSVLWTAVTCRRLQTDKHVLQH